jgi:hypothetical protein
MPRRAPLALLLAALSLAACGGGGDGATGPLMRPGSDCLGCHAFAAAGTVFHADGTGAAGVGVVVTVGGTAHPLTTNAAGNFYLSAAGTVSAASVSTFTMPSGLGVTGHCNGCHGASAGKLTVP